MTAPSGGTGAGMRVAIIGSGNIGTDLLGKVVRSPHLEPAALVGIDPASDGLARARRLGVAVFAGGVTEFLASQEAAGVRLAFDATSAGAHRANAAALARTGITVVDLTPAATGPFVVPSVNLDDHLEAPDVNLVTCGGQATIPVVAALSSVAPVLYGEIVAAISSRSAGPGTRANIDEFTTTTAYALRVVGGAQWSKAIIVLNPADPPLLMRNTVHALLPAGTDQAVVESVVQRQVETVARFVPGYRLKRPVQFAETDARAAASLLPDTSTGPLVQVTVYLEVEGAADYLPAYAGNLDIMTAAAVRVAEVMAGHEMAAA